MKIAQIAIGTLPLGVGYPDPSKRPSEAEAIEIIRAASLISPDVHTLFDTCDWYCYSTSDKGYMERILEKVFRATPDNDSDPHSNNANDDSSSSPTPGGGLIATKGGMNRIGPESMHWRPLVGPEFNPLSTILDSANRLNGQMFLWQLHHCDPKDDLIKTIMNRVIRIKSSHPGLLKNIGLCNVTLEQIIQARSIIPDIVTIQNKFNFWLGPTQLDRELEIINYCEREGLVYMAYNIFGGLSARRSEVNLVDDFDESFTSLARNKNVTPHGLLLGWIINRWPKTVMPIVGFRTLDRLSALKEAYELRFSTEEIDIFPSFMKKKRKSIKK